MPLTAPYTGKKPPLPEPVESLRERIPGWGSDLDHANRPSYPRETLDARPPGATWDLPEAQPHEGYRERSIEHADLTPVFGTAQPLHGVSGAVRRLAYDRYSEGRTAHWLLLMAGDRIDVLGSTMRSFLTTRPDNLLAETGIKAEVTHHGPSSRLGRRRADVKHHWLDPVVVAGPWVAGGAVGLSLARRLSRRLQA